MLIAAGWLEALPGLFVISVILAAIFLAVGFLVAKLNDTDYAKCSGCGATRKKVDLERVRGFWLAGTAKARGRMQGRSHGGSIKLH
jgi:hypothetical protein